jgi:3-hydroxyacyl-CoA dehydrogenase
VSVDTIAVIGAGLMGRGIAHAAATGGFRTLLYDVSAEALDRALRRVEADLDEGVARGKLTKADAEAARRRLGAEADLDRAAAAAGFVIEAVPEEMELKLGLNHPMGPFELGDLVGLDTRLSVLQFLHRTLGEKYRPAPLLVQHVKAGRLGKKVGRGVYDYSGKE